jgi:hypothetical protein
MREPIAGSGLHEQAEIACNKSLAVQIAQKDAEHCTPSLDRGALEACASFGEKSAHEGRRQRVQIRLADIGQIGGKRAEMFIVQAERRLPQSTLVAEVV